MRKNNDYEELENYVKKEPQLDELVSTELMFEEVANTISLIDTELCPSKIERKLNNNSDEIMYLFVNLPPIHKLIFLTMLYYCGEKIYYKFNETCLKYLSRNLDESK